VQTRAGVWSVRDFFDGVAVPGGDTDGDRGVALNHALATEAAVSLQAGGLFDAVFFGFGGFAELVRALFDVDVAGAAGADAAAGVLDVDAVGHGDFEEVLPWRGVHGHGVFVLAGEPLGVFHLHLDEDRGGGWVDRADVHGRLGDGEENMNAGWWGAGGAREFSPGQGGDQC